MRSQSKKKKELNHYLNSKIKEKPKFHEIILELQTIEMGHRRRITQTTKESSQQINKKKRRSKKKYTSRPAAQKFKLGVPTRCCTEIDQYPCLQSHTKSSNSIFTIFEWFN